METELFEGQEEFETLFPVPDGVFYDPESGEYDCETGPFYAAALIQQGKLEAWRTLRGDLPDIDDEADEHDQPGLAVMAGLHITAGELVSCCEIMAELIEETTGNDPAAMAVDPMQPFVITPLAQPQLAACGLLIRYGFYADGHLQAGIHPVNPAPEPAAVEGMTAH